MEHIFITYNQINFFTSCLQLSRKKKKAVEISCASYRDSRITRTNLQIYLCNIFVFRRQTVFKNKRHRHGQTLENSPTLKGTV